MNANTNLTMPQQLIPLLPPKPLFIPPVQRMVRVLGSQRTQPQIIILRVIQRTVHVVYMVEAQDFQSRADGLGACATETKDEAFHGYCASAF